MSFINRPYLLEEIRDSILVHKITNIYGIPGIGKSYIYRKCLETYFKNITIQIIGKYELNNSFFMHKLDIISNHIFVFEDVNSYEEFLVVLNSICFLSSPNNKFIIISREKFNSVVNMNKIEIPPLSFYELYDFLLADENCPEMIAPFIADYVKRNDSNPLVAINTINKIYKKVSLISDNVNIIYKPCIVDLNGNPIEKISNTIKIDISEINNKLLYELSQNPNLLYNLSPYDFERVIAKMFEKKGFSVKITPQTRDGGKDIFIAKNDLCSFLFYVECKKYAPDQHVGIDVIQRLYGVVSAEKATGGIIATTSYFTKPAKDYVQEHQLEHQITLQDYNTISDILKTLQYNSQ